MQDSALTISRYINDHPLAVLSTVNSEGRPHGSTLYAGSDGQLHIYFMTKHRTEKFENIQANPNVALTFSGEDHQTTLQVRGTAVEVKVPDESAEAFQVLGSLKHESQDFRLPISKFEAGPYVVFKLDVTYAVLTEYEHSDRFNGIAKIEFKV